MKTLALALALAFPALSLAHGPGPGNGPGPRGERSEKRMRLARTLGLAEALDLDAQQAIKLSEALAKFDARRDAARRQLGDAREALRRAAQAEKASAQDVEQALQRIFEARAQLALIDKEMVDSIPKDLSPEKRARAALFLTRFAERSGRTRMFRFGEDDGPGPGPRGMMGRHADALGFSFKVPDLPPFRIGKFASGPELCAPDEDCVFLFGDEDDEIDE